MSINLRQEIIGFEVYTRRIIRLEELEEINDSSLTIAEMIDIIMNKFHISVKDSMFIIDWLAQEGKE